MSGTTHGGLSAIARVCSRGHGSGAPAIVMAREAPPVHEGASVGHTGPSTGGGSVSTGQPPERGPGAAGRPVPGCVPLTWTRAEYRVLVLSVVKAVPFMRTVPLRCDSVPWMTVRSTRSLGIQSLAFHCPRMEHHSRTGRGGRESPLGTEEGGGA